MALAQSKKESNDWPNVSNDFINDDKQFLKTQKFLRHKKGGPYSKNKRQARRNEVYRLHFEYGYSTNKIAELMNYNRGTILSDLDHLYVDRFYDSQIPPEIFLDVAIERLTSQITRLRKDLDKAETLRDKLAIEKMIFQINSKIAYIYQKQTDSKKAREDYAIEFLNERMKEKKQPERFIISRQLYGLSEKAFEKIMQIMEEDRKIIWNKEH